MENSKKKTGKKIHSQSGLLDNALLHHKEDSAYRNFFSVPAEVKEKVVSPKVEERRVPVKRAVPQDNGNENVFEIISDLEKQLDAAFSLKDAQERSIKNLKEELENKEGKIGALEGKLDDARARMVSQEKLRLELEAFENERYEMVDEKKDLKTEIGLRSASIKELENKLALLVEESEGQSTRMGQVELELANTKAVIKTLHNQIFRLEEEKDGLSRNLEKTEENLSSAITQRDRNKKELEEAKKSLEEIRLTLADAQARARGRYYKADTQ